jgi:hypothetical protein
LREEATQAARSASAESYWQKRRLEGKLVDRAEILAHVVDAIACPDGGGVLDGRVRTTRGILRTLSPTSNVATRFRAVKKRSRVISTAQIIDKLLMAALA